VVLSGGGQEVGARERAERSGRIAHGLRHPCSARPTRPSEESSARVSTTSKHRAPGRSLVTRHAVVDIVRNATLGSYGVSGFSSSLLERLAARFGLAQPGIDVRLERGVSIRLDLTVAYGVPIAEVARQVDSAVRYGIRRALGCEVDRLAIHVDGLRYTPLVTMPAPIRRDPNAIRPRDLADSGTDVA